MRLLALFVLALPMFAAEKFVIELKPPADIKANYDTPLTATVKDTKGRTVEKAEVEMIVTMLDMDHGKFPHTAKESKPGEYDADAKFFMVGAWNVEVKAKIGGETVTKNFRIEVKH